RQDVNTGELTTARRRFYKDAGPVKRTRINHMIRITPIRVIGADGEQIGVIETQDAMRLAEEAGLDLVEISPDTRPPVCKIMDYGKFKYEQSKRDKGNRQAAKQAEMKEIRLGRSVKIDPHDVQIRVDQARRFLMAGHKVQITQRFRGREMAHKELGLERLAEIVEQLSDCAKVDMAPKWQGRQASIVLSPDKNKVEAIKRRIEKEKGHEALKEAMTPIDLPDDDHDDHDDHDEHEEQMEKDVGVDAS
ncbi:MAG: translation initiation factor IF-3, partial [Phycisphaerales bacterium]|nr:translation initiation factor IF-3 [Phycisphaerales bacterium]